VAAGDNHPIPAAADPMLAGEAEAGSIRVAAEGQVYPIVAAVPIPAAASAEAGSLEEAGSQS
jgi:hypothetical protein